jgi:hypothetical protein
MIDVNCRALTHPFAERFVARKRGLTAPKRNGLLERKMPCSDVDEASTQRCKLREVVVAAKAEAVP